MKAPTLSICIPVYNGAIFLRSAVASVQAQDFSDWELIISDNASTDESGKIAEDLASRDPRIRCHRQPSNLGLAGNLDACLGLAQGTWVGFLPVDDIYRPGLFSKGLQELFDQTNSVGLWTCAHLSAHPHEAHVIRPFESACEWSMEGLAELLFLRGNVFGELSCFFFLRDAGLRVRGGFGKECQTLDLRFWIRLARANPELTARYNPEVFAEATQHPGSESSRYRRSAAHWVELFCFFDEMSQLTWPRGVLFKQSLRAAYCLIRHGWHLPPAEFVPAAARVSRLILRLVAPRAASQPTQS